MARRSFTRPDDRTRLEHILDAIAMVGRWMTKAQFEDVASNQMLAWAIEHAFAIIGEAANALTTEVRGELRLPWPDIIGMRNLIVHQYFEVDHAVLWRTASEDLPALEAEILKYLARDSTGS